MIGFIILRHVSKEIHNNLWIECYKSIRKLYNNPILIIDDNSNEKLISKIETVDCTVIKSEFPQRGELLSYYYFHKLKPFDKAIFLHDSMFIKYKIDFENINCDTIKFLWYFHSPLNDNWFLQKKILNFLNNNNELNILHNSALNFSFSEWYGCYGVSSFVTWDFIDKIQKKYNLFVLLKYINTRTLRMCLERIFSLICFAEKAVTKMNCSILGNIHRYPKGWGYSYNSYINESDKNFFPIVKVWSGR